MGKLRVYCLKTLNELSIYPLGNTPSAPSALSQVAQTARLIEYDGAQSTGIFHGQLQCRVSLLFIRIMTNNTATEGSALIWVEMVAAQLAASHATDGMNEVATEEIFEPILVRVMRIGTTIEVHRQRVLPTLLITSVLWSIQYMNNKRTKEDLHDTLPRYT